MKRHLWRFFVLVLLLNMMLSSVFAQDPAACCKHLETSKKSAADLLPADTIFFFSIPEICRAREDLKATALWKISQEASLKAFFDQGILPLTELKAEIKEQTGVSWQELKDLFQGEVALAFIGLDFDEEFSQVDFKAVLALEIPEDREKWEKVLDYLSQRAVEGGAEREEVEFAAEKLVRLKWPNIVLTYSYIGDYFILTTSEIAWEEVTEIAQEGGKNLSRNPVFTRVRTQTALQGFFSFAYISVENIWAKYANDIPSQMMEALEVSGLLGVKAIAGASFPEESGIKDRVYVYAPGESKGLFLAIPEEIADASLLKFVPADAISFEIGKFSWEILWQEIKTVLKVSLPEEIHGDFEETLAAWEEEVGIDLETDLLRPLSQDYILYAKESEAAGLLLVSQAMADQVFILPLVDSARFRLAYDKLMAFLKEKSKEWSFRQDVSGGPFGGQDLNIVFNEAEYGKYSIDYVTFEGLPFPFQPAATVTEDFLVVTLSPVSARSALSRLEAPGPNIGENEDFLMVLRHLPGKKIALSYEDTARTWRKFYETVRASIFMITVIMEESFIDPSLLPPTEDIFQHFFGTGSSTVRVEDGWIGEAYSTLGTGTSLVAATSLGMGMALPALAPGLSRSRAEARKAVCKSNLKQIGLALTMYGNDYHHFPEALEQLIPDYLSTEHILHCSGDKEKEGVSYIYRDEVRGKKFDHIDRAERYPILYDKPGNHKGGRNLLFADGHVEFLSEAAFKEKLAATERMLQGVAR